MTGIAMTQGTSYGWSRFARSMMSGTNAVRV
jgi:hypothetical protein